MARNTWKSLAKQSPLLILVCLLFPFLVGFDIPDTSGAYVKAGVGRGAYYTSGCHRTYDFEYEEAQLAFRKTRALNKSPEAKGWARFKPDYFTMGASGSFVMDHLVVALERDSIVVPKDSFPEDNPGVGGSLYLGLDWKWIGINAGIAGLSLHPDVTGGRMRGVMPCGSLRLGPPNLYASAELLGSSPMISGGGLMRLGAGGRWRDTRLWLGLGGQPNKETMGVLNLSQQLGAVNLAFAAMVGDKGGPSLGMGIDQPYGLALSAEYRIPGW
jgi:hypothetical protein